MNNEEFSRVHETTSAAPGRAQPLRRRHMNGCRMTDASPCTVGRKRGEEETGRACHDFRKMFEEAIQIITLMVEMRDCHTAGHQKRVAQLAGALAGEFHLSKDRVSRIQMAGLLHDIGKIVVPIEILGKPGRLNEIESAIVRTHPRVGYEMLIQIDFAAPIAEAVLQHHERLDGSGYPAGLGGDEILPEAKILGVADVVEAMCSHRPYRPALGIDRALIEIEAQKGILYDNDVVDACLTLFRSRGFTFQAQPGMIRPQAEERVLVPAKSGSVARNAAR
jgi:putative nucleotidyltransferase with HDIG domain